MEENKNGHPRIIDYILWDGNTPLNSIDFITSPNPPLIESFEGSYNNRGVKIKSDLLGHNDGKLCVRRLFTEIKSEGLLRIDFQWINDDDSIFCKKTKIIKLSNAQWQSRFRKQRERIMDDLKGRAKKYNAEHFVDIIYQEFSKEKLSFVETGSTLFSETILGFMMIDVDYLDGVEKRKIESLQNILNTSLDGVNKVYETLIFLTKI